MKRSWAHLSQQTGGTYLREVLLRTESTGKPVEYGLIEIVLGFVGFAVTLGVRLVIAKDQNDRCCVKYPWSGRTEPVPRLGDLPKTCEIVTSQNEKMRTL